MSLRRSDFLVVGSGVIGVAISLALAEAFPDASIVVIDKEDAPGQHASGRNSGVLHAGFYYTADSLKARFTRDGNHALRDLCRAKGLALNECGKLVVARNEEEDAVLDTLLERGIKNGVEVQMLAADDARQIEPAIRTWKRALYSPSTSVVDPLEVLQALIEEAKGKGVTFEYRTRYLSSQKGNVRTSRGDFETGYLVNAAGLYADQVAKDNGFSRDHFLLPFKGVYLYSDPGAVMLNTNIYPVPDLRNPFLGVHFTLSVDGRVKIGPSAIPAFWPEQYDWRGGFGLKRFLKTSGRHLKMMLAGDAMFRELAFEEMKKYSRKYLASQAADLAHGVDASDYHQWGRPGIRAQLYNTRQRRLEMDFVIESDDKSLHVLNAVSPAFTCALPFARYVVEIIDKNIS